METVWDIGLIRNDISLGSFPGCVAGLGLLSCCSRAHSPWLGRHLNSADNSQTLEEHSGPLSELKVCPFSWNPLCGKLINRLVLGRKSQCKKVWVRLVTGSLGAYVRTEDRGGAWLLPLLPVDWTGTRLASLWLMAVPGFTLALYYLLGLDAAASFLTILIAWWEQEP